MSPWATFYAGREGASYRAYVRKRYAPFIHAIAARLEYHDLVLELGAGTGTISSILADYHTDETHKVDATDIDPEMLDAINQRVGELDLDVAVYKLDAINEPFPTKADIVHSHGMLEHFEDDVIRKVIDNYRHARVQVHYVPGMYPAPTFGDERLMTVAQWWDICKPSQIITFNDGLDYALVFE
jgi:SAM-dependent methyltransferase